VRQAGTPIFFTSRSLSFLLTKGKGYSQGAEGVPYRELMGHLVGTCNPLRVRFSLSGKSPPFPQGLKVTLPLRICLACKQPSDTHCEKLGLTRVESTVISGANLSSPNLSLK
jgi:hypothetical protein